MKPIMFYDGACPLCRREVAHYRPFDWDRRVDWVDIAEDPDSLRSHHIDYHEAMERLHAIDEEGFHGLTTGAPRQRGGR